MEAKQETETLSQNQNSNDTEPVPKLDPEIPDPDLETPLEIQIEDSLAENHSISKKTWTCVNCDLLLEREQDRVTEFWAVFSDCGRNVSLTDALSAIFALRPPPPSSKSNPPPPGESLPKFPDSAKSYSGIPELYMCVRCATILATLYKVYIELMEQSKVTSYLSRISRQVQLWHVQQGQTLPSDFVYPANDESDYRFINSVLAVEFGEDSRGAAKYDEDDGDEISEDDIPISARKCFRVRRFSAENLTKSSEDEGESILPTLRKRSTDIRTVPKKRKILHQLETDEFVQEDSLSDELQQRSKSRRKSSLPMKRSNLEDGYGLSTSSASEVDEEFAPAPRAKRKIVRKRGTGKVGRPKKNPRRKMKKKRGRPARSEHLDEEDAKATSWHCNICGRVFQVKRHYTAHCSTHEGGGEGEESRYKCPYPDCKLTFKFPKNLVKHEKTHLEEKQWQCSVCGKVFRVKRNLTIHMEIHKEEKKYLCPTCGERFAQRRGLFRHLNTHGTNLKHKCPICGKGFKRKDHVTQHLNSKVHPKAPDNPEGTLENSSILAFDSKPEEILPHNSHSNSTEGNSQPQLQPQQHLVTLHQPHNFISNPSVVLSQHPTEFAFSDLLTL